ncbi:iron chelate uptake ABC transporter family permease subunit, partial [Escherichia coli]|uniref:iron chelate uptake ABC transporter family permease subunit n=1 Tax=Escherichia coli TaxID=562 RepID=UPI001E4EF747
GLLVPQIVRRLVSADLRVLLPLSACVGALLLLLADIIARTLFDAPRDKCTLSCAINGIHAAFHYLKKNYISGCVMTVPTG